jgi:hypothetical protein
MKYAMQAKEISRFFEVCHCVFDVTATPLVLPDITGAPSPINPTIFSQSNSYLEKKKKKCHQFRKKNFICTCFPFYRN